MREAALQNGWAILDLKVENHPGVMSHVCGLFARRAFNVEKILCLPCKGGEQSRIWLSVRDDHRLDQVIKQLGKLEDVREVRRAGKEEEIFARIEALLP
ncbi:MAG: acetolactate synthase 1 small subunit [Desulfobacteraceae bacterium]|nr:MAG: acetolactate synthase 1 small subunit [Desulfobacteraceae bacterium]